MRIIALIFLLLVGCRPHKSDFTVKGKYEDVLYASIENEEINFVAKGLEGQIVFSKNNVRHRLPIQGHALRALIIEDNLYLVSKEKSYNIGENKYVLSIFDIQTLNLVVADTINGSGRFSSTPKASPRNMGMRCCRTL